MSGAGSDIRSSLAYGRDKTGAPFIRQPPNSRRKISRIIAFAECRWRVCGWLTSKENASSTMTMVSLVVSTERDYRRASEAACHRSKEMGLIVLLIVLILLFGGGGFYYGPPYHYFGGGLGLLLLIVVVILLFRGRA
jgi:hypothetical protein